MIEYILLTVNGILFPLILFVIKKLYYINHKITELEIHVRYIREELKELKSYIYGER